MRLFYLCEKGVSVPSHQKMEQAPPRRFACVSPTANASAALFFFTHLWPNFGFVLAAFWGGLCIKKWCPAAPRDNAWTEQRHAQRGSVDALALL